MELRILTYKEREEAQEIAFHALYPEKEYPSDLYPPDGIVDFRKPVETEVDTYEITMLEAQAKLTAKQIIQWGSSKCQHSGAIDRHQCFWCWQELKKLMEE